MPTTPNFSKSSFRLVRTIGQTVSPFTGQTKTQEFDAVYWTADVSLPPMKREVARNWQSFLLEVKGSTNHFKFADPVIHEDLFKLAEKYVYQTDKYSDQNKYNFSKK